MWCQIMNTMEKKGTRARRTKTWSTQMGSERKYLQWRHQVTVRKKQRRSLVELGLVWPLRSTLGASLLARNQARIVGEAELCHVPHHRRRPRSKCGLAISRAWRRRKCGIGRNVDRHPLRSPSPQQRLLVLLDSRHQVALLPAPRNDDELLLPDTLVLLLIALHLRVAVVRRDVLQVVVVPTRPGQTVQLANQ